MAGNLPPGVTDADIDEAAPPDTMPAPNDPCICGHAALKHASFRGACTASRCTCSAFTDVEEPRDPEEAPEVAVVVREEPSETAVQRAEPGGAVSPFDLDPGLFRAAVDRRVANVKTLLETLNSILREGEHYGKIHVVSKNECPKGKWCDNPRHFSKNVLLKPGAEKINQFLGLTPRYRPLTEEERKDYGIVVEDQIVVKCELLSGSGAVCSEGLGARALDVRDGPHALNKALKMAEKSARINATIQLGLSDCYTQDLDDMVETLENRGGKAAKAPAAPAPARDMSPELQRSIHEATVKRLETVLKHAPDKMTDEDHRKLAEAKAWLVVNRPKGGDAGDDTHESSEAESPARPAASAVGSGGAVASHPRPEIVPDITCDCGSPVERRMSQKGTPFLACALQYGAKWGRKADAKRMLALVEEQRPELIGKHYYQTLNGAKR